MYFYERKKGVHSFLRREITEVSFVCASQDHINTQSIQSK